MDKAVYNIDMVVYMMKIHAITVGNMMFNMMDISVQSVQNGSWRVNLKF